MLCSRRAVTSKQTHQSATGRLAAPCPYVAGCGCAACAAQLHVSCLHLKSWRSVASSESVLALGVLLKMFFIW